jgi:hypothetical protein
MKSPFGDRKPMTLTQLDDGLMAYRCAESGGYYLPSTCYMRWLSQQPAITPHMPQSGEQQQPQQADVPTARICPESGTIMTRYKVGHGFTFTIDRSITGGIWLDAGEWEALRSRNFHDELNRVFTQSWQRTIRDTEVQQSRRKRMEDRFGTDLLGRIDALKTELQSHPNREELIAYLSEA